MDLAAMSVAHRILRGTRWPDATRRFRDSIRQGRHRPGELLAVGTPAYEPWHFVAHLSEHALLTGEPLLDATWVRRSPVPAGPSHLRHGLERIEGAGRGATVLVVAPHVVDDALLTRIDDARRRGSTVLSLTTDDAELTALSHAALTTGQPDAQGSVPFELAQHLVSLGPWSRRRLLSGVP